jgi:hypothetical protein
MGVIKVDPKEILIDGIRKELVRTVAYMLHNIFIWGGVLVLGILNFRL